MSERTIAKINAEIQEAERAREARAAIQSEDRKWDESRAIFIENCNQRIADLLKERARIRKQ